MKLKVVIILVGVLLIGTIIGNAVFINSDKTMTENENNVKEIAYSSSYKKEKQTSEAFNLSQSKGPFSPSVSWGSITSNPCGGDTTFSSILLKKGLGADSCELFFVWDTTSHILWPAYAHQTSRITYSGSCPYAFSISDTGFFRGTWYYVRAVAITRPS